MRKPSSGPRGVRRKVIETDDSVVEVAVEDRPAVDVVEVVLDGFHSAST